MATYQVLALGHEECLFDYSLDPSRTFLSSSKTQPNGQRWAQLFGQNVPFLKWRLAVF